MSVAGSEPLLATGLPTTCGLVAWQQLSILPMLLCLAHATQRKKKALGDLGLLLRPGRLTCWANRGSVKPGFVVIGHRNRQHSRSPFLWIEGV